MSSNKSERKSTGKESKVICDACGKTVSSKYAIRVPKYGLPIDKGLMQELEDAGAQIHIGEVDIFMCISCFRAKKRNKY